MHALGELVIDLIYQFPDTLSGRQCATSAKVQALTHQAIQHCLGDNAVEPPRVIGCSVIIIAHCPVTRPALASASLEELAERLKRAYITKCRPIFGEILVDLCCVTYATIKR